MAVEKRKGDILQIEISLGDPTKATVDGVDSCVLCAKYGVECDGKSKIVNGCEIPCG
jgi:hypothetical protein